MKSNQIEIINNETAKSGNRFINLSTLADLMSEKQTPKDYADAIDNLIKIIVKLQAHCDEKILFKHHSISIEKLENLQLHLRDIEVEQSK